MYKWMIVIPPKDIAELGWEKNDELEGITAQDTYLLRRKKR
jgi:bifunctional DNA-binding transcriptional regulator/antitoxin component of YhaV-PrlF toxin-antitoxin module